MHALRVSACSLNWPFIVIVLTFHVARGVQAKECLLMWIWICWLWETVCWAKKEAILSAAVLTWKTEGTRTKFLLLCMYPSHLWSFIVQFISTLIACTLFSVVWHFILLLYINLFIGRQYVIHEEYYCLTGPLCNVALNMKHYGNVKKKWINIHIL